MQIDEKSHIEIIKALVGRELDSPEIGAGPRYTEKLESILESIKIHEDRQILEKPLKARSEAYCKPGLSNDPVDW